MNSMRVTGTSDRSLRSWMLVVSFTVLVVACVYSTAAFGQCSLTGTLSTWNIAGNGNWSTSADWNPNTGFPNSPSTSVCITNGTSTVNLDTNAAVNSLQLGSGNTLSFNGNTQLSVYGSQIINNGQILINGGSGTNTYMFIDNSTTLSGAGTLTLADTIAGGGNAYLYANNGPATLTNQSTIQGDGILGNGTALAINNQSNGIINANSTGGTQSTTLLLNTTGGVTNTGLMEATKDGVLEIQSTTVNNAGGNITANGSAATVELLNSTIQGGTLNTVNGGTFENIGTGTVLDGSTQGAITLNGTFTGAGNSETFVLGTINNNGNILLNGGGGTNTYLLLNSNTTLTGGGTVTMNSPISGGGNSYIYQNLSGLTLTNVNNTIQGEGQLGNGTGLTIVNQSGGTINANSAGGTLNTVLNVNATGGVTNTGLMEATNSGALEITSTTVNNAGGNITANGSAATVELNDATIQGGTLNTVNGGTFENINTGTVLDGSTQGAITLNGTFTGAGNTETFVLGTINNNGNILLNGGGGTNTYLLLNSNTTLTGGGTVTMNSPISGGGNSYIQQNRGGSTLTNVNNTIQGEGQIGNSSGLTIVNQSGGTINANSTGGGLNTVLNVQTTGLVTNTGLMEATNSGVLEITNTTVNNAGGNITANGSGATVELNNPDIQGGTLNTVNGGTFENVGNGTLLDGSTQGAITLNGAFTGAGNSQTYLLGTINNKGSILLNGGGGFNTYLFLDGNTTLTGGGTVTMSAPTANGGNAYFYSNIGAVTLTNANNTIQGEGIIGNSASMTVVNQASGIIDANSTGNPLGTTLVFDPNVKATNQGLMEATNIGVLEITSTTVNNAGGNITANGSGATVALSNSDIQGGTLNTVNGGTFENISTGTFLDGSTQGAITLNGTFTGAGNSQTYVFGTFNNNGNILLNGGGGDNTYLFLYGNTTLQGNGSGTVTLNNTVSGGGNTFLYSQVGAVTLTNVNNTIQGAGVIGNGNPLTLVNGSGGTILANLSGQTLLLNGTGPVTNNGTLSAAAGSTLEVSSTLTNFTNTANGTLTGGTYNATGTIQFGSSGTNILADNANIILNGTSAQLINLGAGNLLTPLASIGSGGSFSLQGGANFTTAGNFTNNGTLTVGSGSLFDVNGNLTNISGTTITGGTYNLTGILKANNASGITTNAASITLTGSGALENQAGANALTGLVTNSSGASFTINGGANFTTPGAFANNGTLIVGSGSTFSSGFNYTNAGTTTLQAGGIFDQSAVGTLSGSGTFTNGGTLEATGGAVLDLQASVANTGGTILATGAGSQVLLDGGTISGGTLSSASGGVLIGENSATLNGSTSAVTLSTGSTLNVNNGQTLNVIGSITNKGTLNLNSTGTTTSLVLTGNATLSGTGKLTLSNNTNNVITATTSTFVLTNSSTIQGSGNIGNGAMGIVNNKTISANQSRTLIIDPSATGFRNSSTGTLSVSTGDLLDIIGGPFSNLSGTTLTGGIYTVSGTMQYDSTNDIATNAATITLAGVAAKIIDQNSNNALTGLASNAAAGKFTVSGGQVLSDTASALSNAGAMTVGKNSKLTMTGATATYTQTAGTTTVDGKLTALGGITFSGGSVFGNGGTMIGNTTSSGTMNIGDKLLTAGKESITGTYTQNSLGALNIDVGGLTAGTQFDQLNITGSASLNGTLSLDLINSFVPSLGQTFEILTASSVTGTFSTVNNVTFNSGQDEFSVVYNASNVTLDVVAVPHSGLLASSGPPSDPTPEPGTLILLGSGLLGLASVARRKAARSKRA